MTTTDTPTQHRAPVSRLLCEMVGLPPAGVKSITYIDEGHRTAPRIIAEMYVHGQSFEPDAIVEEVVWVQQPPG